MLKGFGSHPSAIWKNFARCEHEYQLLIKSLAADQAVENRYVLLLMFVILYYPDHYDEGVWQPPLSHLRGTLHAASISTSCS